MVRLMGTGRDAFHEATVCSTVLEWSYSSSLCSINMPLRSITKMSAILFYKLLPLTVKHFRPYLGILLTAGSSLNYIFFHFNFHVDLKILKGMFGEFFFSCKSISRFCVVKNHTYIFDFSRAMYGKMLHVRR